MTRFENTIITLSPLLLDVAVMDIIALEADRNRLLENWAKREHDIERAMDKLINDVIRQPPE